MSNMNKMREETKVIYFTVGRFPVETIDETGQTELSYEVDTSEFTITPWLKREILHGMGKAVGDGYDSPFIILVPRSYISERPKTFKEALPFLNNTLYVVPYIRDITVYEAPRVEEEEDD